MEKQSNFQVNVTRQLKLYSATNKDICQNQSRILTLLKDVVKRQKHLEIRVERALNGSSNNEIPVPDSNGTHDGESGTALDDLSERINTLETRVQEMETILKNADERSFHRYFEPSGPTKENDTSNKDKHSLAERLDKWESMSMDSWSTTSEQKGSIDTNVGQNLKRKGSFKAAFLAIVFVNRLNVTDPDNADVQKQEEKAHSTHACEKTGDTMRAAGLAIIFIVRLMRALQLPIVLDDGMEITPD